MNCRELRRKKRKQMQPTQVHRVEKEIQTVKLRKMEIDR
jgi:hypothetical protein